jgi:hypothetical protein
VFSSFWAWTPQRTALKYYQQLSWVGCWRTTTYVQDICMSWSLADRQDLLGHKRLVNNTKTIHPTNRMRRYITLQNNQKRRPARFVPYLTDKICRAVSKANNLTFDHSLTSHFHLYTTTSIHRQKAPSRITRVRNLSLIVWKKKIRQYSKQKENF